MRGSHITGFTTPWWRGSDPKYILNLLKSIITVRMETMKVVNGLPR